MIYERHCSKLWRRARSATAIQQGDVPLGHNLLLSGHFSDRECTLFRGPKNFFCYCCSQDIPYALVQMCAINRIT